MEALNSTPPNSILRKEGELAPGIMIHPERLVNGDVWPPPVQYKNAANAPQDTRLITASLQLDYSIGKLVGFLFVPLMCKCMFTLALLVLAQTTAFNHMIDMINRLLPYALVLVSIGLSYNVYRLFKRIAPQIAKGFRIGVGVMSIIYLVSFTVRICTGS